MGEKVSMAVPEAAALAKIEARQLVFVEGLTRYADNRSKQAMWARNELGLDPKQILATAEKSARGGPFEAVFGDGDAIAPRFERLGLREAKLLLQFELMLLESLDLELLLAPVVPQPLVQENDILPLFLALLADALRPANIGFDKIVVDDEKYEQTASDHEKELLVFQPESFEHFFSRYRSSRCRAIRWLRTEVR